MNSAIMSIKCWWWLRCVVLILVACVDDVKLESVGYIEDI